jgi:hypothetical protein
MPITFFNEKSGETVSLSTEPQVTAFVNSSDMSINASQGQDMGWRLDVDDKLRIEDMRTNPTVVQNLAQKRGISPEDLKTAHFINEILIQDSLTEKMKQSMINENPAHAEAYNARLKAAREAKENKSKPADAPVVVKVADSKPATKK